MMSTYILFDHYSTKAALEAEDVTVIAADITGGSGTNDCQENDIQNLWQLLACAMLPSSNNAINAIARTIGTKIFVDAGSTGNTGVVRFVEQMNIEAAALGMDDTTYTTPSGQETDHDITAEDVGTLCKQAQLLDNAALQEILWHRTMRHTIDRGGPFIEVYVGGTGNRELPGYRMRKTGIGGGTHRFVMVEMPNGQEVVMVTLDASSEANANADITALYDQLLIDYPGTLGTPGTPYTPAFSYTDLTAGGATWDETGDMWQDTGQVTPASTSDPVARWDPTYTGTAGQYWRQATSGLRPIRQANGSVTADGTDDYLTLGANSIGATGLHAAAGQEFIVGIRFSTTNNGTMIAKGGSSTGSRTFHFYLSGTSASPALVERGFSLLNAYALNSGTDKVILAHWDGTNIFFDHLGPEHIEVGSAADQTSEQIMLFARTISSPGFLLNGNVSRVGIIDQADRNHHQRFRDWLKGNAVNEFRDATGAAPGGGSIVALMMQLHS